MPALSLGGSARRRRARISQALWRAQPARHSVVYVLDAGRCPILRARRYSGLTMTPHRRSRKDNSRQARETAPQPPALPVPEGNRGPAHAGAWALRCNRGGKCRPSDRTSTSSRSMVGCLSRKPRQPVRASSDLLHRMAPAPSGSMLKQSGSGTVVRTGGKLLMRARHAVTVAL